MTRDAQIVFSCIHRMRERFGVSLVSSVLKGSKNKKVLQYNFDRLPTYGMMRERTEKDISELINTFIAEGYLALSEGQYPIVRLQALAGEVLKGQHQVMMRAPEPSHSRGTDSSQTRRRRSAYDDGPSAVNETVFEQLRLIRRELAEKEHVPSYIIFNDATLREMSVVCPTREADMLKIKGVGEMKFRKYGEVFLEFFQNME
ncbi:ATP-dependent DNA helicase RecQ [compost metagenome]